MVMNDDDIKQMAPDAVMELVKAGIKRQDEKIKTEVESQCARQTLEYQKLNPGMTAPTCDQEAALAEVQKTLPSLASPISEPLQIFKDFNIKDAVALYDFICAPTPVDEVPSKISLDQVLEFYNKAVTASLQVDLTQFNEPILPQSSTIFSYDGRQVIGEVYEKENRRTWVPFKQIPDVVKKAFISAEDKNFYTHKGVELRGVLRGFLRYIKDKTIVGGSTLTQQVVKNLILNTDVTLERKVKEMMIATRLEKTLSKDKILEIYLNLINLGRHSWGIETATENYFKDKFVSQLGLNEASFLAGITHSPNRYEPEFNRERIRDRQKFVLKEMRENGYITQEQEDAVNPDDLEFKDRAVIQSSYFHDAVKEDMEKRLDPLDEKQGGLFLFSTEIPQVQAAMERSLQEQLFQYEQSTGRLKWKGALGNILSKDAKELTVADLADFQDVRFWSEKLKRFKALYDDVHWNMAVVLDKSSSSKIQVGVIDVETEPVIRTLSGGNASWGKNALRSLNLGDVIFVSPNKNTVSLRTQPSVQGAAIAMEAKTGNVIALTGGFSYHDSQLNRAIHSFRQPGSTVKPFTYMAALNQGIQPNQILPDHTIRFNPIYLPNSKHVRRNMKCNSWTVHNYSGHGDTEMTLRRGLETSNNRVTAGLLKRIWPTDPEISLALVRDVFMDFNVYEKPQECYPVILGADEVNLMKMAAAYGAIANGGTLVEPHFLDVKKNGGLLKMEPQTRAIKSVDAVTLYQLKNIMSGVVARGTATVLKEYAGMVAGKTGTSTDYNDAWFMGFSNDVVVGVWIGYDNGSQTKGQKGLGTTGTGGGLAAPVAKGIFDEALKYYPPTPLINNPPPGVKLYRLDGNLIEAFRGEYQDSRYFGVDDDVYGNSSGSIIRFDDNGSFDTGYDNDPDNGRYDNNGFYFDDGNTQVDPDLDQRYPPGKGLY
jgi:membrane carboxypeptidase/penicillin-binding protein